MSTRWTKMYQQEHNWRKTNRNGMEPNTWIHNGRERTKSWRRCQNTQKWGKWSHKEQMKWKTKMMSKYRSQKLFTGMDWSQTGQKLGKNEEKYISGAKIM